MERFLELFRRVVLGVRPVGYLVIVAKTKECVGTFYCDADRALQEAVLELVRAHNSRGARITEFKIPLMKTIPVYKEREN